MSLINESQKAEIRENLREVKDSLDIIARADPAFYYEIKNTMFPSETLRIGNMEFRPNKNGNMHFIAMGRQNGKTEYIRQLFQRGYTDKPTIDKVVFNDPATIVMWSDGSKTVVKCQPGDTYSEELGLAMCIAKKYYGNTGAYNEVFKRFIPKESDGVNVDDISVEDMREALRIHCENAHNCGMCELIDSECKCGLGKSFKTKYINGNYKITDDEIRGAYARVFGNANKPVNRPPRVGDYIEIINAGDGAIGANGSTGYVTEKQQTNGLLQYMSGYNVELDNGQVWRISPDAEVTILKPCDKKEG